MPRLKHNRELFRNWESWWFLKVAVMSGIQAEKHVYKMQINVCLGTSNEWDDRDFPGTRFSLFIATWLQKGFQLCNYTIFW